MRFLAWLKENRGGAFAVAILIILIFLDYYSCPFYLLFGLPCPTCGVTRAVLSLFRLDMEGYIRYNAMAAFLLSAVLLFFYKRVFNKRCVAADIYIYAVLGANAVYYVLRLFLNF